MNIRNLMSEPRLTLHPQTPLVDAVNAMEKFDISSAAAVDEKGRLCGLMTEKNLILNDSYIHLKTLIKLLAEFEHYKKDTTEIKEDLKKLSKLTVSDVMNSTPITLGPDDQIEQAANILGDPKINTIPIVDQDKKLLGIVTLSDLTKLYGVSLRRSDNEEQLDANLKKYMHQFEEKFLLVSKFRTRTWMFTSMMFAIVGFVVAFMLILRISIQ